MKFKVGDKVKFLNEKGGGIISRIVSNELVNVAIDDGFDIPVLMKELIVIESTSAGERFFEEHYQVEKTGFSQAQATPSPEKTISNDDENLPFDLPEGIYLAMVPDDQQNLIFGDVEVFLLNNTDSDIIWSMMLKKRDKYIGIDYGSIPKYSEASVQVADRAELELYAHGILQMLFYKETLGEIIPPVNCEFQIKMQKLLKEDNYAVNTVFRSRAYIQKLIDAPHTELKDSETNSAAAKTPEPVVKNDTTILKHKIDDDFAEVDLHIEALTENPNSLSNQAKLLLQLDYFSRCLESAIAANFKRVIFIHGVGAGILKIELKTILDQYDFLESFDASIAKYGIGATEVLIHQKK